MGRPVGRHHALRPRWIGHTGRGNRPPNVAILRNPRTGEVRGILRGPQALNPGSKAAALALEPGLEMLTSRGIPDREDWER